MAKMRIATSDNADHDASLNDRWSNDCSASLSDDSVIGIGVGEEPDGDLADTDDIGGTSFSSEA